MANNQRCPKCGSRILKRTSKNGYTYYACEHLSKSCDFLTWDVPVKDNCAVCGQTMFKKSGRGYKKPYCINEQCSNFVPEDKRGGYKKKTAEETAESGKKTTKTSKSTTKKSASKTTKKSTAAKSKKAAGDVNEG